jgi:hypothetical protein
MTSPNPHLHLYLPFLFIISIPIPILIPIITKSTRPYYGNQMPSHQFKKPHQLILSPLWQTLNPFVINNFDRRVTSQQIKRKGK